MVNLQTLAWPGRRAPKPRTGSSLSCLMLLSWTRATIAFSSRTASFLIAAIASSTVLSAKDLPAFHVMSLRSWITLSFPDIFVASTYSFQRIWKYVQSSLVPAAEIVGRRTFSILAAIVCWVPEFSVDVCMPFEWTESNTAASASSTSSVSYEHSGKGQWYFGMISVSFCRVAKIQDGGRFVTKCFSGVESRRSGGFCRSERG